MSDGRCPKCGGVHYGSGTRCVYRCDRCDVKIGPCEEPDCPRDRRWTEENRLNGAKVFEDDFKTDEEEL